MIDFRQYDILVHRIYDAALAPSAWADVVEQVVQACGGFRGALFTPQHSPSRGGLMVPFNLPQSMIELWAARFVQDDPFTREAIARGLFKEGNAIDGDALVPTQELHASRFYRDLWEPVGIGGMCGGVIFDSTDAHTLPTVLVVFRRLHDERFTSAQLELAQRLLAHLSKALGVMYHLRDSRLREASTRSALDGLSCGVVLLDAQGVVSFMNREATNQVNAGDLWRLEPGTDGSGPHLTLAPRLQHLKHEFKKALRAALAPLGDSEDLYFSHALLLPGIDGKAACAVHAAPLGPNVAGTGFAQAGSTAPHAILFLYDLHAAFSVPAELLVRLFDLTKSEAQVALQVLQGGGVEVIATRLGVSVNTVKSQLQAVYAKTQAHRQADLLKLLLSLASR